MKILVVHGPNLNLLGAREPEVYGTTTLEEVNADLEQTAASLGADLEVMQSNHEGEIIDRLHDARGTFDGVLINAAGLTHTSVALRDAVAAGPPAVEVHLTNIYAREPYRAHSMLSPVCVGGVFGFGPRSYRLGLEALVKNLA